MKQWWQALSRRDQRMLMGGSIALLLLLSYVLVWEPLHNGVDHLRQTNLEQQAILQWMQQSAQQARVLRSAARVDGAMRGGESTQALVERTARQGPLAAALKLVRADGDKAVSVTLESANFDELVVWLDQLQRVYAIELDTAQIERLQPGKVNARLGLKDAP